MFQLLAEQKKFNDEIRRQLKLQSEIHADHLREALLAKEQETQRMLQRALFEQADADCIKYKTQLAEVVGRSRAVAAALKGKYVSSFYIFLFRTRKTQCLPFRKESAIVIYIA